MMNRCHQRRWLSCLIIALIASSTSEAFKPPLTESATRLVHQSSLLYATKPKRSSKASSSSSSSVSRQNKVQSLTEWATSVAKIQTGGVQLQADDYGGLGWFAKTSLPAGSVVLSVPSNIALSVECPGEGPDDYQVVSPDLIDNKKAFRDDMPWYVQMSFYLYKLDQIDATKQQVNLRPWLDTLPRQFDTPIHWSRENMEQLQYPFLQSAVQRQESSWKSYHQALVKICSRDSSKSTVAPTVAALSWNDFVWGCECARSRAFSGAYTGGAFNPLIYAFTLLLVTIYVGLDLGTLEQAANGAVVVLCASILKDFVIPKLFKTKKYVICPMIDMANHQSTVANGEVSFEYFGNAYSLAVDKNVPNSAIPAGNQVFISYGPRSNDQLLQYYGFVERDNPHDVYVMPPLREWDIDALEQACGRQFAVGRLKKLDRAGLLGSAVTATTTTTAPQDDDDSAANLAGGVVLTRVLGIDPAVLQALRALVSTDAEWDAAGQAIGNFAEKMSGGAENEKCARLAAKKAIEIELASKATTIEEDRDLLKRMETMKSLDASRADILAVQFRIEKKRLLQETIEKLA